MTFGKLTTNRVMNSQLEGLLWLKINVEKGIKLCARGCDMQNNLKIFYADNFALNYVPIHEVIIF